MIKKINGKVIHGDKRGRELGYPTANIEVKQLDLPEGVYACFVIIDDKKYKGAFFIGVRKMFSDTKKSVEVYILDFDQNIYDQTITIEVGEFIRPNQSFKTISELISQIQKDIALVKQILL